MRWLVTGAEGLLGSEVLRVLDGEDVIACGRSQLDVTSLVSCEGAARDTDVIINCAAYTAVDDAEHDEHRAFAVNALGARNLATAAERAGARLVQVSTDYVFEGSATAPYTPESPTAPRSAYGRTKLAGEWAVRASSSEALIVRTAWLYGAGGACFPKLIAALARSRPDVSVVHDQVGCPTWAGDVARVLVDLVRAGSSPGTYHATSVGSASWYEFAQAVVSSAGLESTPVLGVTSESLVRPAPRPAWSVLDSSSLSEAGVIPPGDWRDRWSAVAEEVLA